MSWSMKIVRVENGYILHYPNPNDEGNMTYVIQENIEDELDMHLQLLWQVQEVFGFYGSKHDKERISVQKEKYDE